MDGAPQTAEPLLSLVGAPPLVSSLPRSHSAIYICVYVYIYILNLSLTTVRNSDMMT